MLATAVALALSVTAASAGPILNTAGQNLFAAGTSVSVAFLHANAGDTSNLNLSINGGPSLFLFQNNNLSYPEGMTLVIPTSLGDSLVFSLQDLSVPNIFSTGLSSTNVSYTIFDGNIANLNNALFGPGEFLSVAAANAIAALGAGALVISFEDRTLASSDQDFNDLVFGFAPVIGCPANNPQCGQNVPEPNSFGLLIVGALAMFGLVFLSTRRARA
jgi:hypothetical protein